MRHGPRRFRLAVLLAVAFALRVAYCGVTTGLGRCSDRGYTEYMVAGERLLQHGTLLSPLVRDAVSNEPSALLPPLYAGLVAAVYAVCGVGSFLSILAFQLINAMATALVMYVAYDIAARIGGRVSGWLAALLAAFNPTLIGFTTYIWDTNLFCLGVALAALISLRLSEKPVSTWGWLAFGLFLGALALLNPALTVAYPFLVLWPISKAHGWRLKPMLRGVCLTVLGWTLVIAPWTVRNYLHFDELMYVRGGFMLELWLGVCPEADAEGGAVYTEQFPLLNDEVQRRIAAVGERAFIQEAGERATKAIRADPWRLVRLIATRVADYYVGTVYSHRSRGEGVWPRSTFRLLVSVFLAAEFLAVLLCLLLRRPRTVDVWWLLAIVVSFSVVYCLTHVQVRFRAPTEPLIGVVVAVLLAGVWRRRCVGHGSHGVDGSSDSDRVT